MPLLITLTRVIVAVSNWEPQGRRHRVSSPPYLETADSRNSGFRLAAYATIFGPVSCLYAEIKTNAVCHCEMPQSVIVSRQLPLNFNIIFSSVTGSSNCLTYPHACYTSDLSHRYSLFSSVNVSPVVCDFEFRGFTRPTRQRDLTSGRVSFSRSCR